MPWDVLESSLPYLAVLVYVLANAVLSVLASWRRHVISVHDRVREAKILRNAYLEDLQDKQIEHAE